MSLTVQSVSFSYQKDVPVLNNVSFQAEKGMLLSVLGPNGVGKSTLFRCLLGTQSNYSGKILVGDEDLRKISAKERARRIAYIPQTHRPTFGYTVLDTVLMGTTRHLSSFASPGEKQIEQARKALKLVGADQLEDRNFAWLSGGEQQLVLIARALAQQAEILIMDEPTSALDFGNQMRVLARVRKLADEGYIILMSTHNPQHAMSYATHVLALWNGQVAAFGEPEKVMTTELLEKLYGVEVVFAQTAHGRLLTPCTKEGTI